MLLTSQHTVAWSSSANMLQVTVESTDFAGRIVGVGKGLPYNVNQAARQQAFKQLICCLYFMDRLMNAILFARQLACAS